MIRAYRQGDLDRLYEICVRTGSSGDDAWDLVDDKQLFGHIYAAPYGVLEPEHAFVVVDENDIAGGYVLGAVDTFAFERRCAAEWWPPLCEKYPEGSGTTGLDQMLIAMLHKPSHMPRAITETYPSHLHIDLLPAFQGGGWGRRMMETVIEALRRDGSTGLHFGVSAKNERALGFYRHLGFEELHADPMVHLMGTRL